MCMYDQHHGGSLHEKLIVSQLPFMEQEDSLLCSQEPATGPCPELH
jgi:hypothetical protein